MLNYDRIWSYVPCICTWHAVQHNSCRCDTQEHVWGTITTPRLSHESIADTTAMDAAVLAATGKYVIWTSCLRNALYLPAHARTYIAGELLCMPTGPFINPSQSSGMLIDAGGIQCQLVAYAMCGPGHSCMKVASQHSSNTVSTAMQHSMTGE